MEFEYTLNKQGCALLCRTAASVLCWTGASFSPEFKIHKEETEGREYLHLPVVTSGSCILVLPTRWEIQSPMSVNCSWGSPSAAADQDPSHLLSARPCSEQAHTGTATAHVHSQYHRFICQAAPEASAVVSGAQCSAREHRSACCDVLALQFTTGSNSLASAEEMGKTRSSKH